MNALIMLALNASVGPVAFKALGGFVVVSRSGEITDTVRTIGGLIPESLTVSPANPNLFVFTAVDAEHPQARLFRFEKGAKSAELLGSGVGFHAQPSFTNDGAWVYFIHHPHKDGGPPGVHAARAYGQLWRIRIDGSSLEQLTKTNGCKLSPDPRDEMTVAYAHSDCEMAVGVEVIRKKTMSVVGPMSQAYASHPRLSADGKLVAMARIEADKVLVVLCSAASKCSTLATFPRDAEPSQLAWAERTRVSCSRSALTFGCSIAQAMPRGSSISPRCSSEAPSSLCADLPIGFGCSGWLVH